MTDTRHMYGGPGFGHYQGFGISTRAMACKAQAIRAMACMDTTRAMACKATQITAYMEESAAIRDMVGTAVTQAAAMEALRELEAIRACTMKMIPSPLLSPSS